MSKYQMGKDVGMLMARLDMLEAHLTKADCNCHESNPDGIAQMMTSKEIKYHEKEEGEDGAKPSYCVYFVGGFVGAACPGIQIGDFLCVSPCPEPGQRRTDCGDYARIHLLDAQGKRLCTVVTRWANAGACGGCLLNGHKFRWV